MTQPTIPPNDGRISTYVAVTPSTGPFAIDFPFFGLDDVIVELLPDGVVSPIRLVRGPDYSLTATINEDGSYTNGSVTLVTAVSLTTVFRFRNTTIERLSNFPLEGYFSRLALNADLNRFTAALQDYQRRLVDAGGADDGSGDGTTRLDAMLQVPQSEAGSTLVVASDIATRRLRVLAWDINGGLTQGPLYGTLLRLPDIENGTTNVVPRAAGLRGNRLLAWDALGNLVDDQPRGVSLQVPSGELGNGKTLVSSSAALRAKRLLVWDSGSNLAEWHTYDTVLGIPDGETGLYTVLAAAAATRKTKVLAWDTNGNLTQSTVTLAQIETAVGNYAPINSPVFTGNPQAPDPPSLADNDQSIPTTHWVQQVVGAATGGSTPIGPAGGDLTGSYPNPTIKAGVVLTSNPTVDVSPAATDSDLSIATTAMVQAAIAAAIAAATLTAGYITGEVRNLIGLVAAPAGWVLAMQGTIGNAASGASIRANADCANLFAHLWTLPNTIAPVLPAGRGASAAADFAANKTIGGLDLRGRLAMTADNNGGTVAGISAGIVAGSASGSATATLAVANLPPHFHNFTAVGPVSPGGGANLGSAGDFNNTTMNTDNGTGSSTAFSILPPLRGMTTIVKL